MAITTRCITLGSGGSDSEFLARRQGVSEERGGVPVPFGQGVRVDPQRRRGVTVTEPAGHGANVHASAHELRRSKVPQGMQVGIHAHAFGGRADAAADGVRRDWCPQVVAEYRRFRGQLEVEVPGPILGDRPCGAGRLRRTRQGRSDGQHGFSCPS